MARETPLSAVIPQHVRESLRRLAAVDRTITPPSPPEPHMAPNTRVTGGEPATNDGTNGTGVLVTFDNDGAHIVDPGVAQKFRDKKISASLITDLREGCHAGWLAKTYVVPEVITEPEDNPRTRGSLFHRVMEHFFALPPAERTKDNLRDCIRRTLSEEEFQGFATNRDAAAWLTSTIRGYYTMEDPTGVRVATIDDKPGLERFVSGQLPGVSRRVIGFVDRITETPTGVMVEDWKTGAKPKEWAGVYPARSKRPDGSPFYDTRKSLGYAEARQQGLYTLLLEQQGQTVDGARLLFPAAPTPTVVDVPVHDPEFRGSIVRDAAEVDTALDLLSDTNEFTYNPSVLCSWCPLAKVCPAAQGPFGRSEKQSLAWDSQPELEDFGGAISITI